MARLFALDGARSKKIGGEVKIYFVSSKRKRHETYRTIRITIVRVMNIIIFYFMNENTIIVAYKNSKHRQVFESSRNRRTVPTLKICNYIVTHRP